MVQTSAFTNPSVEPHYLSPFTPITQTEVFKLIAQPPDTLTHPMILTQYLHRSL